MPKQNKNLNTQYDRSNQVLTRVKWNIILTKLALVLIILCLGIVDVILVIKKITK